MLTPVHISFLADRYNAERISVQTYLKLFIFMFENIDMDGVRDIYHHLYFNPFSYKKAISWKIHVPGEAGKTGSSAVASNQLGIKDWLTFGCEWVQHRCFTDITCRVVVFHQSRIYGYFLAPRPVVCDMIPLIIMKSR